MAHEDVPYESSTDALILPGLLGGLIGVALVGVGSFVNFHGNAAASNSCLGIGLGTIGILALLFWQQHGRKVTVTRSSVICEHGSKLISIKKSELAVMWPKRGVKTNRTISVTNGRESYVIAEKYFPEFEDLMDDLKKLRAPP